MNEEWTDEKLYKYFDLNKEEVDLIEKTMRPMDLDDQLKDVTINARYI